MNKVIVLLIYFLSSNSLANNNLNEDEKKYELLLAFNSSEMTMLEAENTKGNAGPLVAGVIGAIGGGAMSIASDIQAGNDINWVNAGIGAGSGFVTGASGAWMGGITGAVAGIGLGLSTYGAMSSGCGGCHN